MITFRKATEADVPAVLALLQDDMLGQAREGADLDHYQAAFARMQDEGNNHLIVGEGPNARVIATYQITFISGLSLRAARRAQIESVRVASDLRGQGIGEEMVRDMIARARAAECSLVQLTMNTTRTNTHRFYERMGFVASHTGFKLALG
ncbi:MULTISPECIES: GNAT family N-acetyltransferase [Roseovarius]|uniref:GNAT family N-acetyltransferase n=2 Tax=Roseovarius TaxID=74030 RepID=A0ABZ2HIK3_9RHOB|nr:GNAT family N-acetyltransferase [Roseovarius sp. W115]MDV2928976.1 GNAT family N-acetyltransferase [Roseovarius sp. W115]